MNLVKSHSLSPGEGVKIKRPNGEEAASVLVKETATVDTFETDNYVEVLIRFVKPFIKPKK